MGPAPFRCSVCGAPSDQAAECPACGGRTFVLGRDATARVAGALGGAGPGGRLVPISDAPSLRRRRRTNGSSHEPAPRR